MVQQYCSAPLWMGFNSIPTPIYCLIADSFCTYTAFLVFCSRLPHRLRFRTVKFRMVSMNVTRSTSEAGWTHHVPETILTILVQQPTSISVETVV